MAGSGAPILTRNPDIAIVMLSMHEKSYALRSLKPGARATFLKIRPI
jgi:hypothetical protein